MEMYLKINKIAANDEKYADLSRKELDDRILRAPFFDENPFEISVCDEESNTEIVIKAKIEEIQIAKKHTYIKENYVKWNFLEAFSVSDDYKTEPIDFYFEFKKSSTCSLAELVKNEHRYICNDVDIKEHSIDDLSECIVVHNRK